MNSFDIPDSISWANLNELLQQAPSDNAAVAGFSRDKLEALAIKHVDAAAEACGHPLVHKLMGLMVFVYLSSWLQKLAEIASSNGDLEQAAACMAQVGQLRSAHQLLLMTEISEDDFTCQE